MRFRGFPFEKIPEREQLVRIFLFLDLPAKPHHTQPEKVRIQRVYLVVFDDLLTSPSSHRSTTSCPVDVDFPGNPLRLRQLIRLGFMFPSRIV